MPLKEKDRKRKVRQRRQKRLRALKLRYTQAKDKKSRDIITEKIRIYQPGWSPESEADDA